MIPSLTFLTLSTTDWDAPQFGSRQRIMGHLARRGHRVLFVDIPRTLHSFISDPAGTRQAMKRMGKIRQIHEGPQVYTPWPVLPIYYHPWTNAINQSLMRLYLKAVLKKLGWQVDILWTYWPNTAAMVGQFDEKIAVYHCIDDFAAVGYPFTTKEGIAQMEARQCRQVDLIFTRTTKLDQHKKQFNPHTHLLPGGVDTDQFDPETITTPSSAVSKVPKPRVGLVGTIDDRVDVALLEHCAKQLSDTSFILVGPIRQHRADVSSLKTLANVHFFPACAHTEVPAILADLDVGLIPYLINPYTEGLSPIKLYEFLAMGKPVVTTDLPYLRREADHIAIAHSTVDFVDQLSQILAHPPTVNEQQAYRRVALAHSWEKQVDIIERLLNQTLSRS